MNDLDKIKLVQLEVSRDSKNYEVNEEIKISETSLDNIKQPTMELFSGLIKSARKICKEKNYKTFRLKILNGNEQYFLYDGSEDSISANNTRNQIPEEERLRYEQLTNREKQVLCFLSRGYKQDAIAYVFGMSVHTIKKHRYNIYEKTGFRNKTDLAVWCEKYLQSVFKQSA